jgi:hypothetical protein
MSKLSDLDDYQAVNLLSALRASGVQSGYPRAESLPCPNPLQVLNSGDWIGELIWMLEERLVLLPGQSVNEFQSVRYGKMHPNRTPVEYINESVKRYEEHKAELKRLENNAH